MEDEYLRQYELANQIACPIHGFIPITKHGSEDEVTGETAESDLIDSPWLQRLRRIHQLQAAWWVFPSAEHTRLQHVLGTMHLAGQFAEQLYSTLRDCCDVPSKSLVVETMRLAGLLHDVGHGPFGHFFDEEYLLKVSGSTSYTHEDISQAVIVDDLAEPIMHIRRSPIGAFAEGEVLDPHTVAFLVKKSNVVANTLPEWVSLLYPLLHAPYTVDSMDFVLRDSYMCGRPLPRADVKRLINYSFFDKDSKRLVLHLHGLTSLGAFLQARMVLFNDIYHHRTVRALELHMRDQGTFKAAIDALWPQLGEVRSAEQLAIYRDEVDEWQLMTGIMKLCREKPRLILSQEWKRVVDRRPEWKRVYEYVLTKKPQPGMKEITESQCDSALTEEGVGGACIVNIARTELIPSSGNLAVWNPMTAKVDGDAIGRLREMLPKKWWTYRVYSKERSPEIVSRVHRAMNQLLSVEEYSSSTSM